MWSRGNVIVPTPVPETANDVAKPLFLSLKYRLIITIAPLYIKASPKVIFIIFWKSFLTNHQEEGKSETE